MSGADVLVLLTLMAVLLVATHACSYALGKIDGAIKLARDVRSLPPAELYRRALRERAAAQPRERGRFVAPKEGA